MGSRFSIRTLLLIAAALQIVWGLVPSASKIVIDEIPVELYIAIRWTLSAAIFFAVLNFKKRWLPPMRKETLHVALLGIGGYALGSLGTLYGLKVGGVANFALMIAFSPIATSSVCMLLLRERPRKIFYLALPLCVLGLLILVVGKYQISSWGIAITSALLIAGAALLDAVIFAFSKRLKAHFTSFQYLAIAQGSAAIFFWLLQGLFFQQTPALGNLSARGWLAAVFVSLVACVLCYAILYWLLNYVDGHRLSLFDGLHAVSATLFGVVFFGETINAVMAVGGLLLLGGMILGNAGHPATPKDETL